MLRPGPGRVTTYLAPGGPHVRMDSHLYPDYLVPPNYDSLLGKLIVWGDDREKVCIGTRDMSTFSCELYCCCLLVLLAVLLQAMRLEGFLNHLTCC